MKKQILFISLISLSFLIPAESSARKRVFKKKWSVSAVSGYTFYQEKKPSASSPLTWSNLDGQMHKFFSALEISRNMGHYEFGARIQNLGTTFVSPFFTLNLMKNNSKARFIPALSLGVVPSHIMGGWLRFSLGLSLNRHISLSPFVGVYSWYKIKDDPQYEKYNIHANAGLRIDLYP